MFSAIVISRFMFSSSSTFLLKTLNEEERNRYISQSKKKVITERREGKIRGRNKTRRKDNTVKKEIAIDTE